MTDHEEVITMDVDLELDPVPLEEPANAEQPAAVTNAPEFANPPDEDQDASKSGPQVRAEAVHVHGVDDMATKDIEEYFGDRKPIKIEWINDTSCNAVFETAEQATEAIQDLLIEPTSDINHTLLRKAKVYTMESGRTVNNLHLRLASEWDVKERGARERSRYYLLHGLNKDINSRLGKRRIEKKKSNDILSRLGGYQEPGRQRRRRARH